MRHLFLILTAVSIPAQQQVQGRVGRAGNFNQGCGRFNRVAELGVCLLQLVVVGLVAPHYLIGRKLVGRPPSRWQIQRPGGAECMGSVVSQWVAMVEFI